MLRVAKQMNLRFVERVYKLDEVLAADEALITASSIYVLPVSKIDDHVIADGQAGPLRSPCAKPIWKQPELNFTSQQTANVRIWRRGKSRHQKHPGGCHKKPGYGGWGQRFSKPDIGNQRGCWRHQKQQRCCGGDAVSFD